MASVADTPHLFDRPAELLQRLIQFDTTNPPGNELECIHFDPGPADPDMGLYDTLAGILRESDPTATPTPYMLSGTSDARFFSRLGIQTYGFTPMQLPPDFGFVDVIHAADERIPVEAPAYSAAAIYRVLQRFV